MNGKRLELFWVAQSAKNKFRRPWSPPSKLPFWTANCVNLAKVSRFGRKTKTPELKQSGQPTSGAAENSSRSKSSSQFWSTYNNHWKCWIFIFIYVLILNMNRLTNVSASKKTHFSNWVSRQQWSFVNVIPSSGLAKRARLAASFESSTLTSWTTLNTVWSLSRIDWDTPGVIKTATWCTVLARFSVCATTNAPKAYESFVANVTHAYSAKENIQRY